MTWFNSILAASEPAQRKLPDLNSLFGEGGSGWDMLTMYVVAIFVLIVFMVVGIIVIRKLAGVLIYVVGFLGAGTLFYGVFSGEITSWPQMLVSAAFVGIACAVLCIPALTLNK